LQLLALNCSLINITNGFGQKKGKAMKNQSQKITNHKLLPEDLDRWRNESPAAGQLSKTKEKTKRKTKSLVTMEGEKAKTIPAKRNSGAKHGPDIKVQGWSAKELAEQSAYDDESIVKGQMKTGERVQVRQ
jgi:hypothetical protein